MTIQEIHDRVDFLLDRERGQFFTTEEIDNALDTYQMRELRKYFADENMILQGNTQLMYKQMQSIEDAVRPFLVFTSPTAVVPPSGTVNIPADTQFITGASFLRSSGTGRGGIINILTSQEYINRSNSALLGQQPVAALNSSTTLDVWSPFAIQVVLEVVTRPVKPNFDTNTTLQWNDTKTIDIIYGAVQILGLNASDVKVVEFGGSKSTPQT